MIGPPRFACSRNAGSTDPREPSTLPNRTDTYVPVGGHPLVSGQSLGEAFGVAQHARRIRRLVGADVHEVGDTDVLRCVEHVLRADHVGLPPLLWSGLEQRQVLERRCVEHDVGSDLLEQLEQPLAIADVAEQQVVAVEQRSPVNRQLDRVQTALVTVELEQRLGPESGQLSAQFAADRTSGAGDQHPLAGDVSSNGIGVDVGRAPTEEVGLGDRSDIADPDRAEHLVHRREHQQPAGRRWSRSNRRLAPDRSGHSGSPAARLRRRTCAATSRIWLIGP